MVWEVSDGEMEQAKCIFPWVLSGEILTRAWSFLFTIRKQNVNIMFGIHERTTPQSPGIVPVEERITLPVWCSPPRRCTVQQITTKTGLSKGLVSPYLALMEREGILGRKGLIYMLKVFPADGSRQVAPQYRPDRRRFHKTGLPGKGLYGVG